MVDLPTTVEKDLASAAEILARSEGLSWAYDVLGEFATRHALTDAWLVLHPADASPQVFSLGAGALPLDTIRMLAQRPAGLYGAPHHIDAATNRVLGAMCTAAFRAASASRGVAVDRASGLSSSAVLNAAITRATACGARYGWSATLVLLTTGGDTPAQERWLALAAALRQALRTGDEAGVAQPGVAAAILGNAGPDAVRPFVARVRAALSASGWDDIDLHAATARTPEETVDPSELKRLAVERLVDGGGAQQRAGDDGKAPLGAGATAAFGDDAPALELELRLVPGVTYVSVGTPVVVVTSSASEQLHDELLRTVRSRRPHASLRLLGLADGVHGPEWSAQGPEWSAQGPGHPSHSGHPYAPPGAVAYPDPNGNGLQRHPDPPPAETVRPGAQRAASEERAPRAISATAPRGSAEAAREDGARVSLLSSGFDPASGTSEVSLSLGAARGIGRASAGPLAGGAQATLDALSALRVDVPFYLVSAERAHGVPGEPVVVVLAPKRGGAEDMDGGGVERLGVATGSDDVEAASRATLGALNRHLARSRTTS